MEEILKELNISNTLIKLFKGKIPILSEYSMFKYYIEEDKTECFSAPSFFNTYIL